MNTNFHNRWDGNLDKLLPLVCCPVCGHSLHLVDAQQEDEQVALHCETCDRRYPFLNSIPQLFVDDALWQSKAREAQGWVSHLQETGGYAIDPNDIQLPYYPHDDWQRFAQNFDIALQKLALTGEEVIVDLGANRGWAAKNFSIKGCYAIAVDILADEMVGLGRAWAFMEQAGVHFAPIIADGERLPLVPESADLVFCSATLHHSSNLDLLIQNISRVLKPGGRLCAINEPCISILEDEQKTLARDAQSELDHGINETRPDLIDYFSVLRNNGFSNIYSWKDTLHDWPASELFKFARNLGGIRPDFRSGNFTAWRRYLSIHLRTLHLRSQIRSLLLPEDDRETFMRLIGLYTGGGISFIAEKKA